MASLASPQQSLLDPTVLARIGGLEIVARGIVDGFLGGMHRSPAFGSTTDFAEHRAYMPGDDTRRIDWRLYGRSDRIHVKEFEADTTASLVVMLDISKSMDYASGGRITKLDYGRVLAASLLWLARRQRDRVGLVTFDAEVRDLIPPSGKHLPMAMHALERTRAGGVGDLTAPLRAVTEHVRRRGIVVVISDLYADPEVAVDAVAQLRGRGNELILIHVLDPAERELPADDTAGLQDLETGEMMPIIPKSLRKEYRALVGAHVAALEQASGQRGVTYTLFETGSPLDTTLARFLAARERVLRVR